MLIFGCSHFCSVHKKFPRCIRAVFLLRGTLETLAARFGFGFAFGFAFFLVSYRHLELLCVSVVCMVPLNCACALCIFGVSFQVHLILQMP